MNLRRLFGIGTSAALAGSRTEGRVTKVKTCYWFKVNTKPVRTYWGDGAVYPHIIWFTYCVSGQTYSGQRWVHWNKRCPILGENITVHYEEKAPEKFAVII